jgi:hypothetical protein
MAFEDMVSSLKEHGNTFKKIEIAQRGAVEAQTKSLDAFFSAAADGGRKKAVSSIDEAKKAFETNFDGVWDGNDI